MHTYNHSRRHLNAAAKAGAVRGLRRSFESCPCVEKGGHRAANRSQAALRPPRDRVAAMHGRHFAWPPPSPVILTRYLQVGRSKGRGGVFQFRRQNVVRARQNRLNFHIVGVELAIATYQNHHTDLVFLPVLANRCDGSYRRVSFRRSRFGTRFQWHTGLGICRCMTCFLPSFVQRINSRAWTSACDAAHR